MQLDEELGPELRKERDMIHAVHWTVKYILHDGAAMEREQTDLATGILSGVIREADGVPKLSALHVMSILLTHTGEPGFAAEYVRMTQEQADKVAHDEQVGIEYQ